MADDASLAVQSTEQRAPLAHPHRHVEVRLDLLLPGLAEAHKIGREHAIFPGQGLDHSFPVAHRRSARTRAVQHQDWKSAAALPAVNLRVFEADVEFFQAHWGFHRESVSMPKGRKRAVRLRWSRTQPCQSGKS